VPVEKAIALICHEAGIHFHLPIRTVGENVYDATVEHWLRVFAPIKELSDTAPDTRKMISPTSRDIPQDAPFSDYAGTTARDVALANRGDQPTLSVDARVINAPIYLGGQELWECTLLLRPGWLPHPQLDNLNTAEAVAAAIEFWKNEFGEGNVDDNGVPLSPYHPGNPRHYDIDPLSGSRYADVGRLWILHKVEYRRAEW